MHRIVDREFDDIIKAVPSLDIYLLSPCPVSRTILGTGDTAKTEEVGNR